jgi:hypothetical protein
MATVTELPVRSCQFHGGRTDAKGFLVFCGRPVRPGTSYCEEHYGRIYQRPPAFGVRLPPAEPAAREELADAGIEPQFEREAA